MTLAQSKSTHTLSLGAHTRSQLQAINSCQITADGVQATSNEADGRCTSFVTSDFCQDKLSTIFTKIGVKRRVLVLDHFTGAINQLSILD